MRMANLTMTDELTGKVISVRAPLEAVLALILVLQETAPEFGELEKLEASEVARRKARSN